MPLAEARLLAIELERSLAVLLAVRANRGGWFMVSGDLGFVEIVSVALLAMTVEVSSPLLPSISADGFECELFRI